MDWVVSELISYLASFAVESVFALNFDLFVFNCLICFNFHYSLAECAACTWIQLLRISVLWRRNMSFWNLLHHPNQRRLLTSAPVSIEHYYQPWNCYVRIHLHCLLCGHN